MASRVAPFACLVALLAAACAPTVVLEPGSAGGPSVDPGGTAAGGSGGAPAAPPSCVEDTCAPPGFVYVPPGPFTMGAPASESGGDVNGSDEQPPHEVTISRGFFMLSSEVTQGKWQDLMGNNPSLHVGQVGYPVETVNFWDALAFANALSDHEGLPRCYDLAGHCSGTPGAGGAEVFFCSDVGFDLDCVGYRLPTEAEWEYAARAGTSSPLWNGAADDTHAGAIAWYAGDATDTQAAGQKLRSPWHLYDMSGNVEEWVWDRYDPHYYETSPATDPTGPDVAAAGLLGVVRGGSFADAVVWQRAASRDAQGLYERRHTVGFRVVRGL